MVLTGTVVGLRALQYGCRSRMVFIVDYTTVISTQYTRYAKGQDELLYRTTVHTYNIQYTQYTVHSIPQYTVPDPSLNVFSTDQASIPSMSQHHPQRYTVHSSFASFVSDVSQGGKATDTQGSNLLS